MPQPIRVNPHKVVEAAVVVGANADQLQAGHTSTIAAAQASQPGLVGQSAQAIASKTQLWQDNSAQLHRVLASHGAALHASAQGYADTEDNNAATVNAIANGA